MHEWDRYALVIDARSPHEYNEDHVPGAVNLPVVDDEQYAEVGIRHKTDKHGAYLIGVEYSLQNIARHIKPLISRYTPQDRFLVYCFRGGKRSRLWADNLRTIGFEVDVISGGWKNYRSWVRAGLETLPSRFSYRVLCGPTGCGKTRLLHALERQGAQVLDLESLASHRGSLIGALPGEPQPTQKMFDSLLLERMRTLDPARPVWLEAESKKIGNVQLPLALFEAMHRSPVIHVDAPMAERVLLWREDYAHFATDPVGMVRRLEPLKPLVGKETLGLWHELAAARRVDELFESVMARHYDPCYQRSTRRNYGEQEEQQALHLTSLGEQGLADAAEQLLKGIAEV
ncbi:tRNA 2-selenouridine synthase [Caldimonas brevitalea]|uniref:tRNA 2-selenouridine synthase n=1 Tax=Caldimonas brevitalea TaxID=413882 RepID=A0A0G3BU11_9BURK|nr:tRNA 2-selenouridine synthase [Caldimonas brevitalea]